MINIPKNIKLKAFIRRNSSLFWYIKETEKENIPEELLVETILNWGDLKAIGELIKLLGIRKTADIFYKNTSGRRTNYRKKTINLFNLYFEKNSHRNPYKRAKAASTADKTFF